MSKSLVHVAIALLVVGWFYAAYVHGGRPRNPLARPEVATTAAEVTKAPPVETASTSEDAPAADPALAAGHLESTSAELIASIKSYVDTPDGGIDWKVFGRTKQRSYSYSDKEGRTWEGARPEFPDDLKQLDGQEILVKGYMFPLGQQEKQPHFLLGPFPVSCPYHYYVTPSLLIEVHAKKPVRFSYDAVSIRGKLELVPKDDEYNVFYRLNQAQRVP